MLGCDPDEVIRADRGTRGGARPDAALADDSPPGTSTNRNLRSDGGILHWLQWSNRRLVNPPASWSVTLDGDGRERALEDRRPICR